MTQEKWTNVWRIVAAIALALSGFATALAAISITAAPVEEPVARVTYTTDCRMERGGDKWTAASGCEWEIQSGATLDIQSGATLTMTSGTVDGDLTVDDTVNVDDTAYALTGTQTLTPTATYYEINSSGVVTITLGDGDDGDVLWLVNKSANNVVVADTNIRTATGSAITLGQYDVLWLMFTGTEWYQISLAANS